VSAKAGAALTITRAQRGTAAAAHAAGAAVRKKEIVTNYRIQRRLTTGPGAWITITRTGTGPSVISSLTPGSSYDFRVRAETANAASRYTEIVQATPN